MQHDVRTPTGRLVAIAVASLLAAPIATWWLVGDLSETRKDPDHLVRLPTIDPGVARAAGVSAVAVVVVCILCLIWWNRHGAVLPIWWSVEAPILALGLVTGFALRVITAGVSGANIGGALLLYVLPLPILATLLWVIVRFVQLRRTDGNRALNL